MMYQKYVKAWCVCLRGSIITNSYKIIAIIIVNDKRENGVLACGRSSREVKIRRVHEIIRTIWNMCGFPKQLFQIIEITELFGLLAACISGVH